MACFESTMEFSHNGVSREAMSLSHSARSPNSIELANHDHLVGKREVFGQIFYELGLGESKSALDQDVHNYID